MPLATVIAAASFICMNPSHPDGNTIRCAGRGAPMRLYGIDAPLMPGKCRPGRACIPGSPYAARDHLAILTRNKRVKCTPQTLERFGQRLVRCTAGKTDLSCGMIAAGFAFERQTPLACPEIDAALPRNVIATEARSFIALPPLWRWIPISLIIVNIVTYFAFAADKDRVRRGLNRISDIHLLALVLFGGGAGALFAQQRLDHMKTEQPFANQFAVLLGLQFGLAIGVVGLAFWAGAIRF